MRGEREPASGVALKSVIAVVALLLVPRPLAAATRSSPVAQASPAAGRPAIPAVLADVAWISGRWLSNEAGTFSEESWSPPAGDSMVGTWRLAVEGRVKVFELLTMVEDDGKVVLRLRHFDRRGVAWEEKDAPLVLTLVARAKGVAVFEGREQTEALRLTYRREGRTLIVALEKGKEPARLYRFRRAPAA